MKREFLTSLGLGDDAIEKIMAEHGKDINSLREKITSLESEVGTHKQTVSERDKQLEELKKSAGDSEKLQNQIAKLQEENKKAAEEHKAAMEAMKLDNAVKLALTNAKVKDIDMLRVKLNLEGVTMEGETVKGLDDQIAKLRESHPYMFDGEVKPTIQGTPPGKGGGTPAGKPYREMTYTERVAYLNAGGTPE